MESLVLATTLLLSSQGQISSVGVENELTEFVQNETNRVTQVVQYREQLAAQDTFLYQAKLVINQAKQQQATLVAIDLAAE